jgi:hypothetical protein
LFIGSIAEFLFHEIIVDLVRVQSILIKQSTKRAALHALTHVAWRCGLFRRRPVAREAQVIRHRIRVA